MQFRIRILWEDNNGGGLAKGCWLPLKLQYCTKLVVTSVASCITGTCMLWLTAACVCAWFTLYIFTSLLQQWLLVVAPHFGQLSFAIN